MYFLLISVISFVNLSALINSSSDRDGQKSFMSKMASLYRFFIQNLKEPFYNFTCIFSLVNSQKFLQLVIFLIEDFFTDLAYFIFFASLISLTLRLFLKFALWYFYLIKTHSCHFLTLLFCYEYYRLLFFRLLLSSCLVFCSTVLFLSYRGWMSHPQMLMFFLGYGQSLRHFSISFENDFLFFGTLMTSSQPIIFF